MKQLNALWLSALLALAIGLVSAPAQAENAEPAQPLPAEISDDMLDQFVVALEGVREIGEEYSDQINNAEDAENAQALQSEAQQEMVVAVEESGLTVREYNALAQRMNEDQALMSRFQSMF